jgi:hypothetical protein
MQRVLLLTTCTDLTGITDDTATTAGYGVIAQAFLDALLRKEEPR